MNDATRWRLALARQISAAYGVSSNVAAVYVAGSVARGWADRYSDIELDVSWGTPPSDAERLEIIRRAGGKVDVHWADPPGDARYRIDGLSGLNPHRLHNIDGNNSSVISASSLTEHSAKDLKDAHH